MEVSQCVSPRELPTTLGRCCLKFTATLFIPTCSCVCLQEWEKLNYDIHTLRYARREVRSRWKKILLQLGYQCEVDALLSVNRQSLFSRDREHLDRATGLLKQLLDHTSLFPPGTGFHNRYLFVMVCMHISHYTNMQLVSHNVLLMSLMRLPDCCSALWVVQS
uniref:Melanoregulin n=1 Tax=Stegastes partitus TaxID=144197 RepID=A0A3B5BFY4_9TELE